MTFWNIDNPQKPKGVKDPDAVLDYPINWSTWLTDISDTYLSHSVISLTGGLVADSSTQSGGIITVWLSGGNVGETASFTVRIVSTGGRTDDRTFYLKIKER
jgi:hypothetical protein